MIKHRLRWAALVILSILAVLSLYALPLKWNTKFGGIDYHIYWIAGQYLRQGIDPYQAYLEGRQISGPIQFLDGELPAGQPAEQPGLATVPANTAPITLLLSPLSFFTWRTAWLIWLVCNFALMLAIPWLLLGLLPRPPGSGALDYWLVVLAFLALFGPRNSAGNGQTSLLVFALMLLSLRLAARSAGWSGLALGIALSKYSLALPLFLYFAFQRRWRILFYALLVQVACLLALAALTHERPLDILRAYVDIVPVLSGLPGIHLGTLFSATSPWQLWAPLIFSLAAFSVLIWIQRKRSWKDFSVLRSGQLSLAGWLFFSALNLWSLLVAYHRGYDTFVSAPMLAALFFWLPEGAGIGLQKTQQALLWLFLIFTTSALILPATGVLAFLSIVNDALNGGSLGDLPTWLRFHSVLFTVTLLSLTVLNLLWLLRLTENKEQW